MSGLANINHMGTILARVHTEKSNNETQKEVKAMTEENDKSPVFKYFVLLK